MTEKKFDEFLSYVLEKYIKGVMCKKSAEYARGDDKLYNFKRAALMSGKTPLECLRGMKLKHDVSIDDMLNDELKVRTSSADDANGDEHTQEQWQEKLSDDINYMFLMWAILFEKYGWELK